MLFRSLVADVPRPFEAIVAKLLAKDPNMRYPNAEALRDDLRRYRSGEPVMALASVAGAAASLPRSGDTGSAANVTRTMPRTAANPTQGATTVMARTTAMAMQQQRRPDRNNWYGVAAFIALLALVAGGIVLFNVLKHDSKPTSFALPNVVGQQLDVAGKTLQDDLGLTLKLVEQPTADVPEGAVISTDPPADTLVTRGQEITVVYNPIKAPQPIPEVRGKTVDEATTILTGAGFKVSPDTVFVVDSTITPGNVLSTNPPFGESAVQGTVVILTVSKAPDQVSVPDLTGQAGDAAKAILEAEPYTFVVTITQEPSADIAANTVLRTDPPLNTPVAKGSNVTVIVSAGPAKVKVPPVEGLTEAAARNQLTNRGLLADVQFITVAIGSPDDGHVILQSIPPTESVNPGTTIRLKVGKAAPPPTTTSTTTTQPPPTTPAPSADVSVTITDGQSTTASGNTVIYTIVGKNTGPSPAASSFVSDIMPSGLSGVTWLCTASGGASCPASGNGNINSSVDLPVGGSVTFTVTGTVSISTGNLVNTVTISGPGGVSEVQPSNNSATDSDLVV